MSSEEEDRNIQRLREYGAEMKIKKICRKIWNKVIYYAFPTIYSWILFGVLLVGGLLLVTLYNEDGGQVLKAEELLVTYTDLGGNHLEMHLSQEQGSSTWIELYSGFWGIVIAIVVFLLEISGNYKYGITLKRIVIFSIGHFMPVGVGIVFLLLCPLAYKCQDTYRYKTLFAIIVFSFVFFCLGIGFLVRISMRKYIRKLIEKRSRQQILQIRGDFSSESIPRLNDSLLLREVIEHTEYSNISEWENMTAVISRCITNRNVKSCLIGTLAEHTLLKAMTKHIIYKSGLESEYVLIQTVDILDRLLEKLIRELENNFCKQSNKGLSEREKEKTIISFTLQVMLPLFDYNSHNSIKAFLDLWGRYGQYQMDIISYIYLYLYYRSLYGNGISKGYWEMICQNRNWKDCLEHRNYWNIDEVLALELWMDWEQYNGNGTVKGLMECYDFVNKLKDLQICSNKNINIIIPEYL